MRDVKRTNKRTEKAQETRRRVLAAALELFARDGYGAANLQDVAARAGVAVQTCRRSTSPSATSAPCSRNWST